MDPPKLCEGGQVGMIKALVSAVLNIGGRKQLISTINQQELTCLDTHSSCFKAKTVGQ